ncbi:MAG TPA: RNA polymerase-binding protein DksA [Syntrophales bacterium]|jgi:DnaK suppressor protein|nr:RNA polymerase-binding protein DksA [Syntrophales bacterium]HRT62146.1 RNA polymerase-binding protein DksA [Syntrophales bacterium]
MKPQELKYFKKMLNGRIDELVRGVGRTVSEMSGEEEIFADPNDRASQESERNLELRIRERERKLILKMKEALRRIEDGTFGICEECEEPISLKRLKARPVTTLCIECKTREERRQKMRGLSAVPALSFAE